MNNLIFKNREHAGKLLAGILDKFSDRSDVIVLSLPRGGVPVASEVAKRLHAPMDVMVVRKLGVPGWEELAMGAIASGGVRVINEEVVRRVGIPPASIEQAVRDEMKELRRREIAFRGNTAAPDVKGKTVILVDDGIATGSTIRAAVQALRQQEPNRIVIAAPTAAVETCDMLEPMVDELVVLSRPTDFRSVGQWYEDFQATTDAEVKRLMVEAGAREPAYGIHT